MSLSVTRPCLWMPNHVMQACLKHCDDAVRISPCSSSQHADLVEPACSSPAEIHMLPSGGLRSLHEECLHARMCSLAASNLTLGKCSMTLAASVGLDASMPDTPAASSLLHIDGAQVGWLQVG